MYIFVAKAIIRPRVKQNYIIVVLIQNIGFTRFSLLEKYFDLFNHFYHLEKESPIWVYGQYL